MGLIWRMGRWPLLVEKINDTCFLFGHGYVVVVFLPGLCCTHIVCYRELTSGLVRSWPVHLSKMRTGQAGVTHWAKKTSWWFYYSRIKDGESRGNNVTLRLIAPRVSPFFLRKKMIWIWDGSKSISNNMRMQLRYRFLYDANEIFLGANAGLSKACFRGVIIIK
jgi:hypothetical protein